MTAAQACVPKIGLVIVSRRSINGLGVVGVLAWRPARSTPPRRYIASADGHYLNDPHQPE